MNQLLKSLLVAIVAVVAFPFTGNAQMEKQVIGAATSVLAVGFDGTDYTIRCNFISFQSYAASSIQVGDYYSVEYSLTTPKSTVRFEIQSVSIISGSQVQLVLRPLDGATLISFPTTNGTIYKSADNFNFALIEANVSDFLKAGLINHNFLVIDSILANLGGAAPDTNLGTFNLFLDEVRTFDGLYGSAEINWDSVTQTFTGDDFTFTAFNKFSAQADTTLLKAAHEIQIETPGITAATRTNGMMLTLINATTGRAEWDDIGKYLPEDADTDSIYFAYGPVDNPDSVLLKTRLDTVYVNAGGSQSDLSEYSLLGGDVTVMGTDSITAAFAGGVWTITVPAGGVIAGYTIDVAVGDATYSNGTVSDAIKIVVDNSANGTTLRGQSPIFMARTAAGAVTSGNPLQYNTAINTASQVDQFASGITSIIFQQIPGNAAAGGVVMW